jgi:hypothetical protein
VDDNTAEPGRPLSPTILDGIRSVVADCEYSLQHCQETATVLAMQDQVVLLARLIGVRDCLRAATRRKSRHVPAPPPGSPGSLLSRISDTPAEK